MSRLSQMLQNELRRRGQSEHHIAREMDWSQQAFNTWLKGSIPRKQFWGRISRFLQIPEADVETLAEEAKTSQGNTRIPPLGSPVIGRGSMESVTMEKFAFAYAKPQIEGCYAVRLDGRHYWVNPLMTPVNGNKVLVRSGTTGKIDTWPCAGEEVHVIVLAEMV